MRTGQLLRIRVDGVDLAVTASGPAAGVPVVVLHGFTGSAQAMDPLSERLAARLTARMICPDLVGHGRSDAPADLDCYRIESIAEQVTGLADALGCETFHLVGYSMGGRVALTLGCTASRRLRSLTLIGASAGIADPAERRRRAEADEARAECLAADLEAFVDSWMADPLFAGQAALGEAPPASRPSPAVGVQPRRPGPLPDGMRDRSDGTAARTSGGLRQRLPGCWSVPTTTSSVPSRTN